jgi:fumarate hydratase class II
MIAFRIIRSAALVNGELGADAGQIRSCRDEVIDGELDALTLFVWPPAAAQNNANANEVISGPRDEMAGGVMGKKPINPNDHVNRGQSSNNVSSCHARRRRRGVVRRLRPHGALRKTLNDKARRPTPTSSKWATLAGRRRRLLPVRNLAGSRTDIAMRASSRRCRPCTNWHWRTAVGTD